MNNLRNRTSSRPISRANAEKALDRICQELDSLIYYSPGYLTMPTTTRNAREEVALTRKAIEALFIHTKP